MLSPSIGRPFEDFEKRPPNSIDEINTRKSSESYYGHVLSDKRYSYKISYLIRFNLRRSEESSRQRANYSREKEMERNILIDRFENENDSLMKKFKVRNSENDSKHQNENEKELQNIEVLYIIYLFII